MALVTSVPLHGIASSSSTVSRTIGQGCLGCPGKACRAGAQAKHVGMSPTPPSALEVMVNPCPDLNKIACQITQAQRT